MKKLTKKKKLIMGACISAAVIIAVVLIFTIGPAGRGGLSAEGDSEKDSTSGTAADDSIEYETQEVGTSEMIKTLTAAGEITAAESEDIEFSTSKTFKAMCVEENEAVKKGQNLILYGNGTYETAPADGVIVSINAPDTGSVGSSENLIEFGRTGTLSLEVTVPEDQISEIEKGDEATIVIGSDSSKTFYGEITEKREMSTTLISEKVAEAEASATETESGLTEDSSASGLAGEGTSGSKSADPFGSESSTAYYTVVLEFKNDGTLKPGMSASCTVTLSDRTGVLTVPVEAVYFDSDDKPYVNIGKGSRTEKQKVKIGESDAENVEITKGLKEGDTIQVPKQK